MKKLIISSLLLVATLGLSSCVNSDAPLTESEQAKKYNMSVGEYKETKSAAAKMNMTIEDHMKMMPSDGGKMDHDMMDMGDDSSMIEDDSDMGSTHKMNDGTKMDNSEKMEKGSTHTMDDGTTMTEDKMHTEMMHDGEEGVEEHSAEEHGKH